MYKFVFKIFRQNLSTKVIGSRSNELKLTFNIVLALNRFSSTDDFSNEMSRLLNVKVILRSTETANKSPS